MNDSIQTSTKTSYTNLILEIHYNYNYILINTYIIKYSTFVDNFCLNNIMNSVHLAKMIGGPPLDLLF